jgi:hypothetical protein
MVRRWPVAIAAVALLGVAACVDDEAQSPSSGGPTPAPTIAVAPGPSAQALGAGVRTGIVIGETELVIYFWGSSPFLDSDWLRRDTFEFLEWPSEDGVEALAAREAHGDGDLHETAFIGLRQIAVPGYPIIEFGAIRAEPSRIVIEAGGHSVDAAFTSWSHDPRVTIFWLQRAGEPLPDNTAAGEGRWDPLPPESYPLVTAYDQTGNAIDSARLRPPATEQKGG